VVKCLENVRGILEAYRVFPVEIEKYTNNLYRIKGNNQTYALKKSILTNDSLLFWHDVYRVAQAENLQHILPVYINHKGDLFTQEGNRIYYLTPWIDSQHRTISIEKIYQTLGYIHAKTRKMHTLTEQSRDQSRDSFLLYRKQMDDLRKELLRNVEQFESRHFMSPVELLVCTQYRDLLKAFYLMDKRLEQYLENQTDINEWQVSLCHGNLTGNHILQGDRIFFINWERAKYEHPIVDLSHFLKDRTLHYDNEREVLLEKFKHYMDENKLSMHELTLLSIYLLNPSNFIQAINRYVKDTAQDSMIEQVIQLQRLHRQIIFGIQFSEFIEAEYEMVHFDESSSET
jgi:spore coat protein YsxE